MLFSNEEVANYINENFESTWKAVRPVPKVSIDFGNGNVVNRTLHGNIATFVCTPDGAVIDVIPGLDSARVYLTQLADLNNMARRLPSDKAEKQNQLRKYYNAQIAIETGTMGMQRPPGETAQSWDDFYNSIMRRKQIHERLGNELIAVKPQDITKWLYKEVLHADLDDPYLGLKETLFATYPFREDRSL